MATEGNRYPGLAICNRIESCSIPAYERFVFNRQCCLFSDVKSETVRHYGLDDDPLSIPHR